MAVATDGACSESENHRRQERCGDAVRGSVAGTTGCVSTTSGTAGGDEVVAVGGVGGASGNYRRQERQERCDGDVTDADRDFREGTTGSEVAQAARVPEVCGKLFAALTRMGFRRGETRDALERLAQNPRAIHAPLDELLRATLGLLTPVRS